MTLTRTHLILLAAGGSAALMLGALAFQHIGGMAPCKLCIWQRYPHVIAIVIGAIALAASGRLLPLLGALAALTTAGIGAYHTGVERKWWEGPSSCSSTGTDGLSADDLFDQIIGRYCSRLKSKVGRAGTNIRTTPGTASIGLKSKLPPNRRGQEPVLENAVFDHIQGRSSNTFTVKWA